MDNNSQREKLTTSGALMPGFFEGLQVLVLKITEDSFRYLNDKNSWFKSNDKVEQRQIIVHL